MSGPTLDGGGPGELYVIEALVDFAESCFRMFVDALKTAGDDDDDDDCHLKGS